MSFAKESDWKYVELLNKENHGYISEFGEYLKSGNDLIFPLKDFNNQVRFLAVINSYPRDSVDELSIVFKEIKEVHRFVSMQMEKNYRFVQLKTVNLVSQMSHDINSLIALIPKEDTLDDAIRTRIKNSEIISREIMFYLRELSINKSNVPVKNLFFGITSGISFPENVTFNLEFIHEVDSLSIDVELVDRAISSIIMNAGIATSIDGGEIKMTVGKRKNISPFIKFDWLEIIITDTGPGIPKEFLNEVRNPLFTTWKNQGHVGLGLAIADKIIQAHSGYLDIKSTGGKGTMVSIYLPLS
jgi:signal transduction histidine kinase